MSRQLFMGALAVAILLGGCASPKQPTETPVTCIDPWPCLDGRDWPAGLEGPFELAAIDHVRVPTLDGLFLDGWVFMPDTPADIRLPTVLLSSPYPNQGNNPGPDDPGTLEPYDPAYLDANRDGVPGRALVEAGFAFAVFNLRGTGSSGGCVSLMSSEEQQDQATLVEWIAQQRWSNGRVGMMGLSIPGTVAMEAASLQPPALKAIVVAGTFPDLYQQSSTPQGAMWATYGPYIGSLIEGEIGMQPPVSKGDPLSMTEYAEVAAERACDEPFSVGRQTTLQPYVDDRNEAFWSERRVTDRFANVTAAVLLAQGFHDGNLFTDDEDWAFLEKAPKLFLHGPWGHQFPKAADPDWTSRVVGWFDFWLKGRLPVPPGLGTVIYQDNEGAWRNDTRWPPSIARSEVLYLADGTVSAQAHESSTTFRSAPVDQGAAGLLTDAPPPLAPVWPTGRNMLCPPSTTLGLSAVFETAPLTTPATIAGNPFVFLTITADQAGGMLTVALVDLGPAFSCLGNAPQDARLLAIGAADLRFANGNFVAQPPPVDTPFSLRIDMHSIAETVTAGHRVAVAFGFGDTVDHQGQVAAPSLTLRGDGSATSSQIILPVVGGTLGGAQASLIYPPRPFGPSNVT